MWFLYKPRPLPTIFRRRDQFPALVSFRLDELWEGQIPSELGYVESLETLLISSTSLNGTLPTELGLLKHLKQLNILANSRLGGSLPSELAELNQLNVVMIANNNFDQELPQSLTVWNNVSFCQLSNDPDFHCATQELLGVSICNIQCDGNTILGTWMNENTECYDTTNSVQFNQTQIVLNGNGTWTTLTEYLPECGARGATSKTEGTFNISQVTLLGEGEFSFLIDFQIKSRMVNFSSLVVMTGFQWFCGWDVYLNIWNDLTHATCFVNSTVEVNVPSIQQCPFYREIGYVNFKNSTLKVGNLPLDDHPYKAPCQIPSRSFSAINLRRSWSCQDANDIETCLPVCGDGVILGSEQCEKPLGIPLPFSFSV